MAASAAAMEIGEAPSKAMARTTVLDPEDRLAKPLKLLVGVALSVLIIVLIWKTNMFFPSEPPRRRLGPLEAPRLLPPILRRIPDPLDLDEPPEDRPLRIMLLGDSITEGCCDGLHLGYRYYLWEELEGNGHHGHYEFVGTHHNLRNLLGNNSARTETDAFKLAYRKYDEYVKSANNHEGRTGAMTRDVWAPIEELLFRQRPDVVVVLLGNNDLIGQKFDQRRVMRAGKDLGDLPDKLLKYSPHGTMMFCSLVPSRTPAPDVQKFNQMVESVASKWGLPYIDLTAGYDPFMYNHDDIHPDYSGEIKIAEKIYDALVHLLPPPEFPSAGENSADQGEDSPDTH